MSKLNHDILYEIFQNLQDLININSNYLENSNKEINYKGFKRSQFSCLLVNKSWCEVMIPFLWSNPFKYGYMKSPLFETIISHLSDNSIKILKDKNIIRANFQKLKLSFNYIRFCKYFHDLHIFPVDSKMLLKEEIYKLFISECSSIKCLNSDMAHYPISKYPGANISLSNLYEIYCSNTIDQDFYYGLAQICRSIEEIYVRIYNEESSGIAELIEMQKQIKYVFIDGFYECKKITQALEKHANSIIHLETTKYTSVIHFLIPKLINLRYLKVNDNYCELKKYVIYLNHYNLQVLDLCFLPSLDIAINIIKNTNGNLWKIRIENTKYYDKAKEYNQKIHKYCPNIKYVTVFLNRDGTLEELEKIFIKCQHLEAIYIDDEIKHEYIDKFLNLLLELAPLTLCKIHISYIDRCFNTNESLELFLINWDHHKGKKTLHLYSNYIKINKDIVDKYDIKDFWNDYFMGMDKYNSY
ncbi:uncharacterized protein OCT59_024454 [Rhizophagus irregularis]|uniref:F-box domain-containing protein n=2 Tax=Rhizophagus irregularis TaxID=588596 RepID=A0A015MAB8_RHIIW|nr:hypothetical protein GLOIN_2v1771477 [Rhizophagus irregularis DAOM 181602=DAOM 197198]EXX63783.1 hypothetical protein RirG_149070 [Rhizophagus irregularis DAOM 197198w]UZO04055.1 hypothetical protein OCT59_024454 [Rhizophagus irregularis]POG74265.1 hypothetical protein GLOIN_2v1771477 [Rhizophagus irregularis DAOM 181602=DAOM 197198]CAG8658423.1 21024_t:CDS:1 [Rhizophagus irregularis]GBC14241.1 hypothetical protein GLOIN_2v1771477 [Rhizophagus irregularis DAOM 181602=DAOM 197198]|eukprot:XP_025181131.1 hypothetical protein GLOIN_2v1771477 [Rhizophagus irregularis DAOM 181602=DAOM 197198]